MLLPRPAPQLHVHAHQGPSSYSWMPSPSCVQKYARFLQLFSLHFRQCLYQCPDLLYSPAHQPQFACASQVCLLQPFRRRHCVVQALCKHQHPAFVHPAGSVYLPTGCGLPMFQAVIPACLVTVDQLWPVQSTPYPNFSITQWSVTTPPVRAEPQAWGGKFPSRFILP